MSDEEHIVLDTPKSRRAVTEVFTDEQEKRALRNTLKLAQDILENELSSTPDRRWAAQVIKDFGQLKHGKVEKDVPHFRLSLKDVYGNYIELNPREEQVKGEPVKNTRRTAKGLPAKGSAYTNNIVPLKPGYDVPAEKKVDKPVDELKVYRREQRSSYVNRDSPNLPK